MASRPAKFGYRYAEWTTGLLQAHLADERQVAVSDGSLCRQLHALGYRWKRPRYTLSRPGVALERRRFP
jgi:transposase